jgi:serine/threonine protein kinase/tetratricopeptide (TPR) repeat protein
LPRRCSLISNAVQDAAGSIADGTAPDWTSLEASSRPDERGVLSQLRLVAALVGAQRAAASEVGQGWGPLKIVERVGHGSFGAVYRAYDPRLARQVALKLLDAEVPVASTSLAVEEGRLLARVRHPNVVTVFGADVADGQTGLWMEFIEGITIDEVLRTQGPAGAHEAAVVGRTLCGALAAVHASGLVHGDIKAPNVMREHGGRVVLMDFGAGRDHHADAATHPVMGTPLYVAPELLGGAMPSARSDIYSLGVLLFHLVTGSYPTPGSTLEAVTRAHEAQTRVRLRDLRPDLPDAFISVIEKACALDPSDRYGSAGELEAALGSILHSGEPARAVGPPRRRIRRSVLLAGVVVFAIAAAVTSLGPWRTDSKAATPVAPERSVVVLPMVNQSRDPEAEYLVDGMTEGLIRELSMARNLRVTSRTSSMYFKKRPGPVREMARLLDVDLAIESSLRTSAGQLEVEMTLVDARTDRSLWTRRFVAVRSQPAQLEAEIALELLKQFGASPATPSRAADDEAYRWYLKGRYQWNKRTSDGLRAAREHFDKAIETDPTYAVAHAGLAETYLLLGAFSWLPAADVFPLAGAAAERALELDPALSAPHAVKGYLLSGRSENSGAYSEYLRAIELDPNNVTARQWYALSLMAANPSEAVRQIEIARRLDPLSKIISSDAAVVYKHVGRWDEAIAQLERTIQLYPDFAEGYIQLGNIYEQRGDPARAAGVFQRAIELGEDQAYVLAAVIYNLAASKDIDGARVALGKLQQLARHKYVPPGALAIAYASLGDETRAMMFLKQEASPDDMGKATMEAARKPGLQWLSQLTTSIPTRER